MHKSNNVRGTLVHSNMVVAWYWYSSFIVTPFPWNHNWIVCLILCELHLVILLRHSGWKVDCWVCFLGRLKMYQLGLYKHIVTESPCHDVSSKGNLELFHWYSLSDKLEAPTGRDGATRKVEAGEGNLAFVSFWNRIFMKPSLFSGYWWTGCVLCILAGGKGWGVEHTLLCLFSHNTQFSTHNTQPQFSILNHDHEGVYVRKQYVEKHCFG